MRLLRGAGYEGNAALLLAARLTSAATTLVVLVLVSQLRGAEALGAVGVGLAVGAIAAAITDFGSNSLLIRDVARRPAETGRYLGAALQIRALATPLVLVGVYLVAQAIAPSSVTLILLVAAGLIAQQTAEASRSSFIAARRMTISSAHSISENLAWLSVVTAGLVTGVGLTETFAAALSVWLVSVAVGLGLVRRLLGHRPAWMPLGELGAFVGQLRPFAGFAVANITYSRIDPLLIGLLASGASLIVAGSFFAAARLLAAFEYLPEAVSRAIYPDLSRQVVDDPRAGAPLIQRAATPLLAIGLAVPVVLIPAGAWTMDALFGEQAGRDGWILGVLAIAVPIRYLGYLFGMSLTSADAPGRRLAAVAIGLVLVVAIDTIGIPTVGVIAPVSAAIIGATAMLAAYGLLLRRRFGAHGVAPWSAVPPIAAALIAVGVGVIIRGVVAEPVAGAIALAAYAGLVVGLRAITTGARIGA